MKPNTGPWFALTQAQRDLYLQRLYETRDDECDDEYIVAINAVEDLLDSLSENKDCEHENLPPGEGKCPDCGMMFVLCRPCSKAGGADRAIYHGGPACAEKNIFLENKTCPECQNQRLGILINGHFAGCSKAIE